MIPRPIAAALVAVLAVNGAQAGTMTVSAQSAAGATTSQFPLFNPGTSSTAGYISDASINLGAAAISFSPDVAVPRSGRYAGSSTEALSPFTGTKLAATEYFSVEPSDPAIIRFDASRTSFDLLWGSVDAYNTLTIDFCSVGKCIAGPDITGADVAKAAGINADGSTSAFVELSNTTPFQSIEIESDGIAFEFVPQAVPEPMTLSLVGFGVMGLAIARRRVRRPA